LFGDVFWWWVLVVEFGLNELFFGITQGGTYVLKMHCFENIFMLELLLKFLLI
jgi:hypothetical protein